MNCTPVTPMSSPAVERGRELQAGMAAEEAIQLPPRGTKASEKKARSREKLIDEQEAIREEADQVQAERQ